MAQHIPGNPPPAAVAYEDPKNNGNRKTDQSTDQIIGGAEKGGAGLARAQSRMPPDSDAKIELNKPKSTN